MPEDNNLGLMQFQGVDSMTYSTQGGRSASPGIRGTSEHVLRPRCWIGIPLIGLASLLGCGPRDVADTHLAPGISRPPEDRAALDALRRFVRHVGEERIAVEPNRYLPGDLKRIDRTEVEFLARQQLLDRHRGRDVAPVITRVHVYRSESDPRSRFHVAINQVAEGGFGEGFKLIPYGMGIDYSYQVTGDDLSFVSQSIEVE